MDLRKAASSRRPGEGSAEGWTKNSKDPIPRNGGMVRVNRKYGVLLPYYGGGAICVEARPSEGGAVRFRSSDLLPSNILQWRDFLRCRLQI